jgi:trans-aconitate methyltransferase
MRLLEVGCGAGAVLWCLRSSGAELYGVDYSAPLIEHARLAVPEARFAVAEAANLPFEADAVLCHSVFQYFPDLDYARRVLNELRRIAPVALVMDVPDLATRDEAERTRVEAGSKSGEHLYYDRAFFDGAHVWTSDVPGYGNARFRFNALFRF